VIGGGLAGLATAIDLGSRGVDVLLIEKDPYPRHKVCGEYISNEVLPYLEKLGVDPFTAGAVKIDHLNLSQPDSSQIDVRLPLGGFGISRYKLDALLFELARKYCRIEQDRVTSVYREGEMFTVGTQKSKTYISAIVVGAFGKRSNLDKALDRSFFKKRTNWMAVKAHYRYDHPEHVVSLHQFEGGYCGLSRIETGGVNACYLASSSTFKKFGSIERFQEEHLSQNSFLKTFFDQAEPLFEHPLSISQISFERKPVVDRGIFMIGDSAGLIHPLCGNGMAMAFRAASIWSKLFLRYKAENWSRELLVKTYINIWNGSFRSRLQAGNILQGLLLNPLASQIASRTARSFPGVVSWAVRKTHGTPFA
jgi:flavin-dependent dehydrogenase